ncbi:hypothetical protein FDK21_20495 [Cohaesibacter sp. CAU 1516]|nr:hypothetical protein FDK21_20495 [Cohaesibacter sp. CAU 1516]
MPNFNSPAFSHIQNHKGIHILQLLKGFFSANYGVSPVESTLEFLASPIGERYRRRRWTDEEKAQIVCESLEPGASVNAVAERHGIRPNHPTPLDKYRSFNAVAESFFNLLKRERIRRRVYKTRAGDPQKPLAIFAVV